MAIPGSARFAAGMIYGYARVSMDGQSVDAQVRQLRAPPALAKSSSASGGKIDRTQLRRLLAVLAAGRRAHRN